MLSKNINVINGKRIYLTLFKEQDITSEYISWLNNSEVTKYSRQGLIKHDLSSSQEYLKSFKNSNNLFLSIKSFNKSQLLGTMTAYHYKKNNQTDLGIMIGIDYWGKGYGQEAWNLLVDWLLKQDSVAKVTGATLDKNTSMLAIMKNSGMNLQMLKKSSDYDNKPCNIVFFSKQL